MHHLIGRVTGEIADDDDAPQKQGLFAALSKAKQGD
jgi:hypothetical protein